VSDSFPRESREVASKLPVSSDNAVFYSSPLRRCRKLATDLTDGTIHFDDRLKELDFGEWELQRWDEIDSGELEKWMKDFVNVRCPGGESFLELRDRVTDWWNELNEEDYEAVVVVTHAGVIRCLLCHVLEMPFSNGFRLTIEHGNMAAVSVSDNRYEVKFINR
jgi:alpha-ribazole phosphatase